MAMAPDFPSFFTFGGVFSKRSSEPREDVSPDERAADCARREMLNRAMCENAGAVEGEHGMQAMMSMYPRHF